MQMRFKPKVVARRQTETDDASTQAGTSAAPGNDAFKDLILAVGILPCIVVLRCLCSPVLNIQSASLHNFQISDCYIK